MKTMPKPMLQLILKKLQLPKTPRMVPKTLKQDNVDADAVAELDVEPDADVAPAVVTEREREELLLRLNSGT